MTVIRHGFSPPGQVPGEAGGPRLVSAEFLKLRKRRGLVISTLGLTVLPMLAGYTVLLILHAANPAKYGPAGGINNLSGSIDMCPRSASSPRSSRGDSGCRGPRRGRLPRARRHRPLASPCSPRACPPASCSSCRSSVAVYAITATGSVVADGLRRSPSASHDRFGGLARARGPARSRPRARRVLRVRLARNRDRILLGWQIAAAPMLLQIKTLGSPAKDSSAPQPTALHPPLSSKAARKCRSRLPQRFS